MLSGDATNTNFTILVWPDRDWNSRSTTLEENMIIITSPMRFPVKDDIMDEHVRKVFVWNSSSTIIKVTIAWYTLNTFRNLDPGGRLPSSVFFNHVQSLNRIHTLQIKANMLLWFMDVYYHYQLHHDWGGKQRSYLTDRCSPVLR